MPAVPAVPAVPSLPPLYELSGKQLAHIQVGQVIAPGKTGVVFRAHDTRERKDVALKVFLPDFSRDDEEVQRFLRAMKTTLRLRHPHLVSMLSAGRSGSLCWVAMELVEGVSLSQAVHQAGAGAGDWRVALRAVLHVARALAFLHGHHIIHRNITPSNILISARDGTVKLGDLMKAKAQEGKLAQQVTQAGEILGDLRFMSPEQSTNASAGDGRADLYSLGAVAYALLIGRAPLEGRNFVETILKIRQTPPQLPRQLQPAIPPAFEAIVMKLLAKRPEDRFQSPGELLAHLSKMAGGLS
jgi:serine/threonine-protein kinase